MLPATVRDAGSPGALRPISGVLAILGAVSLGLSVYVLRKLFDRRRGTRFPIEETVDTDEATDETAPMR